MKLVRGNVGRAGYNLVGMVFGRLTVLAPATSRRKGRRWLCRCVCGKQTITYGVSLLNGTTVSCGCYQREVAVKHLVLYAIPKTITHGGTGTPLHRCWGRMVQVCENKNHPKFKFYGAKGIVVCAEWRHDFAAFRTWAITNGWKPGLQLDRLDGNKGYSPDNCHWVSASEHSKKTRAEAKLLGGKW